MNVDNTLIEHARNQVWEDATEGRRFVLVNRDSGQVEGTYTEEELHEEMYEEGGPRQWFRPASNNVLFECEEDGKVVRVIKDAADWSRAGLNKKVTAFVQTLVQLSDERPLRQVPTSTLNEWATKVLVAMDDDDALAVTSSRRQGTLSLPSTQMGRSR